MDLNIAEVLSKKDLKQFMVFPNNLYAGCPYYVPPLVHEEMAVFSKKKNPVFENAEARLFLARRDRRIVGRIAAIISHIANEKFQTKNMRFGWFDFIEDYDVAAALLSTAEDWGRANGMETITGPHGFNDFDKWGMLIEGYETVPTFSSYYNYPYYVHFTEKYGFQKDADAFEYRIKNLQTTPFPQRYAEMAQRIMKRKGYSLLEFKNRKELMRWAPHVFDLLEEAYADLYGVVPLTPNQRNYYAKKYFPFLDPDLSQIVVNKDNQIIGLFIGLPNLSEGLQKAKGKLLPFGLIRLLRAARKTKTIDFILAAVRKGYRCHGVDVIMAHAMHNACIKRGFEQGESNPELEANPQVRAEWQVTDHVMTRRRRIYKKQIPPA